MRKAKPFSIGFQIIFTLIFRHSNILMTCLRNPIVSSYSSMLNLPSVMEQCLLVIRESHLARTPMNQAAVSYSEVLLPVPALSTR